MKRRANGVHHPEIPRVDEAFELVDGRVVPMHARLDEMGAGSLDMVMNEPGVRG